jgi:hypothetical protein
MLAAGGTAKTESSQLLYSIIRQQLVQNADKREYGLEYFPIKYVDLVGISKEGERRGCWRIRRLAVDRDQPSPACLPACLPGGVVWCVAGPRSPALPTHTGAAPTPQHREHDFADPWRGGDGGN